MFERELLLSEVVHDYGKQQQKDDEVKESETRVKKRVQVPRLDAFACSWRVSVKPFSQPDFTSSPAIPYPFYGISEHHGDNRSQCDV